jgi:hypothetical protein
VTKKQKLSGTNTGDQSTSTCSKPLVHLTEEKHAETKPTGATIALVIALIITIFAILACFRFCHLQSEPTPAPILYPETITQPIIPALPVTRKPVHKYHPSPNIPCKIGIDCGCIQVKNGVKGRCE